MTPLMTTLTHWQDRYMAMLARVQGPAVENAGRLAEAVARYVPERPDWRFLADVPTVTDVVDNQLAFHRRRFDERAAFVRQMLEAMHPALLRWETPAAPAAPTATAKTTTGPARRRTGARAA